LIINVQDIGYGVYASSKTLSALPPIGQKITLWIEMLVRQESMTLYGFMHEEERQCFRRLLTVQGVGAKAALSILSVLTPSDLFYALQSQDKTLFLRAEGIGPKLASRIITELKDKVTSEQPSLVLQLEPFQEAVSALVHLGYSQKEVSQTITKIMKVDAPASTQELIKKALAQLAAF
ncbi:MAG: Holliday junction branch migration protein RuvA, partial [Proteobacteria bacterium]|nr:Holliday junction branch migration protein RuvA [Pseudomonadota bacterium]